MSASTSTSGAGAKVSLFAAKSGFVIPKNKLSGSLVPVCRGAKKAPGLTDGEAVTTTDHVQRKTKWGPDLTQDASVRQGRALAYQTRVDQITQQLQMGNLEPERKQDFQVSDKSADYEPSDRVIDAKNMALLELEMRDIIGEILKLNPSYKAPPDYRPLLKEATVPIPVKEFPGYNFIGLIFGPQNDAKKQLEKETGARIQVLGTRSDTGEKVDISPSDVKEMNAYEELCVHVSAETFEKVDAAVNLIDLLLSSVSGNFSAGDNANFTGLSDEAFPPLLASNVGNQGVVRPVVVPPQNHQQGHFQFQNPCFPAAIPQAPVNTAPQSSSSPIINNPMHLQSPPFYSLTVSSLFHPQPVPASVFNTNLQNPSLFPARPQPTVQGFSNPFSQSKFSIPSTQPSFVQGSTAASFPSPLSQTGPPPILKPSFSESMSSDPPGPLSERSLIPAGSISGQSGAPSVPTPVGTGSTGPWMPPIAPIQGPQAMVPRPGILSSGPSSDVSAATFQSGVPTLQSSSVLTNPPNTSTHFPSSTPAHIQASPMVPPLPNPSINPVLGYTPVSSPLMPTSQRVLQGGVVGSFSGQATNFTPLRPSIAAPKLQHSGTGDFTFQPLHPHNPGPRAFPGNSNWPSTLSHPLTRPVMQSPGPPAASIRLPLSNSGPQPGLNVFPRPHVGNQMGQVHAHTSSVLFTGDPTISIAHRVPAFSNSLQISPPVLQMESRNFSATPQRPNLGGRLPPRSGNPLQLQENHPAAQVPRGQFVGLSQPFSNHSFASGRLVPGQGGQQFYDPFSPTSVSIPSQQGGGNSRKGRKQENDPEYEDLMASVGVK